MFDIAIFRVRSGLLSVAIAFALISSPRAAPNTLTVQDPRPVAKAIEELDNRYGWQITYEDLPYAQLSVMFDVAPLVQENSANGAGPSRTVASKERLIFALPSPGQTRLSVITDLVKAYNANSGGNTFAVVQGARLIHVVPQKVAGLSRTESVKPVLDTVITVEPKERTAFALLEEICQKVSIGANTTVAVGTIPINMLMNQNTAIGGRDRSARSILESLILEFAMPLSWQLFYDPEFKTYALNIDVVASASQHGWPNSL